jgi:hypothetical protein
LKIFSSLFYRTDLSPFDAPLSPRIMNRTRTSNSRSIKSRDSVMKGRSGQGGWSPVDWRPLLSSLFPWSIVILLNNLSWLDFLPQNYYCKCHGISEPDIVSAFKKCFGQPFRGTYFYRFLKKGESRFFAETSLHYYEWRKIQHWIECRFKANANDYYSETVIKEYWFISQH